MEEEIIKLKKENKVMKTKLILEISRNESLSEENKALKEKIIALKKFIGGNSI